MEFSDGVLRIEKVLTDLDEKVVRFVNELEDVGIEYVIVSGYVAILTGRSRGTEDIDLLIEEDSVDEEKLSDLFEEYWCIDTSEEEILDKLEDDLSIRLAEKDEVIPNFELFYPTTKWDRQALVNRLEVNIRGKKMFISPLELQISYKLRLGAEKDIEDAIHLFTVFKEDLDIEKLEEKATEMRVEDELRRIRET